MWVKSTNIFICVSLNTFIKPTHLNVFVLIPVSYENYRKGLKLD